MGGKSATTFTNVDLKNVVLGVTTFIRIFGDSLVPKMFVVPGANDLHGTEWPSEIHGMRLGGWVQDIRRAYKRKELSDEFVSSLKAIDFAWSHKEYLLEGIHLPAIRKYREIYNTLDIPIPFLIPAQEPWERKTWGLKLGRIFANLRTKYQEHTLDIVDGKIQVTEDGNLIGATESLPPDDLKTEIHSETPTLSQEEEEPTNDVNLQDDTPSRINSSDRFIKRKRTKIEQFSPSENNIVVQSNNTINGTTKKNNSSGNHVALMHVLRAKNNDLNGKLSAHLEQIEALKTENNTLRVRLDILRQEMQHKPSIVSNGLNYEALEIANAELEMKNSRLMNLNQKLKAECLNIEGNEEIKQKIASLEENDLPLILSKPVPSSEVLVLRANLAAAEKEKQHLAHELSRHKSAMNRKRRKLENMSQIVASTFRAIFEDITDQET